MTRIHVSSEEFSPASEGFRRVPRVGRTDVWFASDRRGDAFNMTEMQDELDYGKEEDRTNDTPERTQAGPYEFEKDVLPVAG